MRPFPPPGGYPGGRNLVSGTLLPEPCRRTENWNYDGIYRLTSETISLAPSGHNGNASYSLDPVGNRLSDASSLEGIASGSWGFNADDEISSETYDANGNVTATDGKTFVYDSENHLMSMNGSQVTIVYDGDGNRVAKTVNGVTTYFLVDDLNPTGYAQVVEELAANGTVERQYTYGLQRISENQQINNTWTPSRHVVVFLSSSLDSSSHLLSPSLHHHWRSSRSFIASPSSRRADSEPSTHRL